MRPWLWLICLAGNLMLPGLLRAASFDCAKAATKVEKRICAEANLSELDGKLAGLFRQSLAGAADKDALRASQRDWIKTRDACPDDACLARVYADRIAVLEKGTQDAPRQATDDSRGWTLRRDWFKRLQWPQTCEQEYAEQFSGDNGPPPGDAGEYGFGVDIHKLAGDARLAVVQCSLAAYQGTFVVVWFEDGKAAPGKVLDLKDYERDSAGKATLLTDDGTHERVGLPDFDPTTGTLTFLDKARGVGDCGSLVTYAFKGTEPVVTEARAQYCFDSAKKRITDPKKWPKVEAP